MSLPEGYGDSPRLQLLRYIALVEAIRGLELVSLRFRYVKGGSTYLMGFYYYYPKHASDVIEPDDHNSLVEFARRFLEYVEMVLGVA